MKNKKGFTFIETLVVVGITAILATTVIIAINPAKRFEDARDKQREVHLRAILNAIYQYRITMSSDCPDMPDGTELINVNGEARETPVFKIIGTGEGKPNPENYYNLYSCLVPTYLTERPYDPAEGSKADTRYKIWQNPYNKGVTLIYEGEGKEPIIIGEDEYLIFNEPLVITKSPVDPQNIAHTWVVVEGEVTDDGGATVWERGVIWGTGTICETETGLTILEDRIVSGEDVGTFEATITNLIYNTDYCARAYARNDIGIGYGDKVSFHTLEANPKVTTLGATDVAVDRATLQGRVDSPGPFDNTIVYGYFRWGRTGVDCSPGEEDEGCPNEKCPNETDSYKVEATENEFSYTLDSLPTNIDYSFQACAESSYGKCCGKIESFYTEPSPPIVTTKTTFNIGAYDATPGGIIEHNGGQPVTSWGICYAEGVIPIYPDPEDCITEEASAENEFYIPITGLKPGRGYWVFAFAKNGIEKDGVDAGLGEPFYFTTPIQPPVVETSINNITNYTADLGGTITGDGGATILEHGVCQDFAYYNDPTYPFDCLIEGNGQEGDTFSFTFKNFLIGQQYNVKAFAKNSKGIGYGQKETFSPVGTVQFPQLDQTEIVDEPGVISAEFQGIIQNNGGAQITDHGFCWSEWLVALPEDALPTDAVCESLGIFDEVKVVESTVDFNFKLLTQDLTPLTPYFVWAFAKNSRGYGYGYKNSFTTKLCDLPQVETYAINPEDIGSTYAWAGGRIIEDGGDPRTKGGLCYSLSQNPEYPPRWEVDVCTEDGVGEGEFQSQMTNLVGGNTYHYRAYADNPAGTAYGVEYSFVAGLANGQSCTKKEDCRSQNCIDGYCCNNACTGTCMACNIAGYLGICTPIPATQDPANECETDWFGCQGSCLIKGSADYCNGAGACSTNTITNNVPSGSICTGAGEVVPVTQYNYCAVDNICTDGACSGTKYYIGCNGSGSCRPSTDHSDNVSGPVYAATGYTLNSNCETEGTTLCGYSNDYNGCSDTCKQKRDKLRCDASHACTYDVGDDISNCTSGTYCSIVDGKCISGFCGGTCKDCVNGACVVKTTTCGANLYGCTGTDAFCSNGTCKSGVNGQECVTPSDCCSGNCIDGYCCNTVCSGNCDRCNVVGSLGTCTNVNSDCTGNCDVCSLGNCVADATLCTGSCGVCSGSSTVYNCVGNDSLCAGTCVGCSCSDTVCNCVGGKTTNWGAGGSGCSDADKRCVAGVCRDCSDTGGFLYSDGCNGCAGQGGNACWRSAYCATCGSFCSSYGGCVAANWNDNSSCTVCRHWYPGATYCWGYSVDQAPLCPMYGSYYNHCDYRVSVNQNCWASIGSCYPNYWTRFCVCQY